MHLKRLTALILIALISILFIGCDGIPFIAPDTSTPREQPSSPPPPPTFEPVAPDQVSGELKVHFIDVGQGDAILIDIGGTEILIDAGGRSPGVTEYLRDYVDGPIEVMVATHPHADHIGGLIAVLDTFEVGEIWLNGDSSSSKTVRRRSCRCMFPSMRRNRNSWFWIV